MNLRLRPDLVLVLLPPAEAIRRLGPVWGAQKYAGPAQIGVVRQIGDRVVEPLRPGDVVIFSSLVGEEIDYDNWPHLLIRESDLEAVVEQ